MDDEKAGTLPNKLCRSAENPRMIVLHDNEVSPKTKDSGKIENPGAQRTRKKKVTQGLHIQNRNTETKEESKVR